MAVRVLSAAEPVGSIPRSGAIRHQSSKVGVTCGNRPNACQSLLAAQDLTELTGSRLGGEPVAAANAVLATISAAAAICAVSSLVVTSPGVAEWGSAQHVSKSASTAP